MIYIPILGLLTKSHACTYKWEERAEVIILNMIWDKKEIKV